MSSKQLTNSALGTIIYPLTNGPVAQLGAHHIRIVGVVGSNPIRSTKKRTTAVILPWFFFYIFASKIPIGILVQAGIPDSLSGRH